MNVKKTFRKVSTSTYGSLDGKGNSWSLSMNVLCKLREVKGPTMARFQQLNGNKRLQIQSDHPDG